MTLDDWLVFVAVSIAPAVSPGPAVVLALSNSLRFDWHAALWSAFGNSAGLLLVGSAVAFGLGGLMAASATAFMVVKLIGAAYLAYIGIRILRGRGSATAGPTRGSGDARRARLFREAFLVALTNPKAIVILLALIPQFLEPAGNVPAQAIILSLTYGGMCFVNHAIVAACGSRLKWLLTSARGQRNLDRVIGTIFIGLGIAMATASRG